VQGVFRERISARPGETLPVLPQAAQAHLFDKDSGNRL
jgi:multiple sugar transport system ATP-binding protein